jgi:hypothetical protein
MGATAHAIAMLALFPLVLILLEKFGSFPRTWEEGFMALVRGLGGYGFAVLFMSFAVSFPLCGPYPYTQVTLAAQSAGMCVGLGRAWKIRFWLLVIFIAAGILLHHHYYSLLRSTGEYAGLGDDGRPYITCSKPVTAYNLWHTSFTAIYGLKPQ